MTVTPILQAEYVQAFIKIGEELEQAIAKFGKKNRWKYSGIRAAQNYGKLLLADDTDGLSSFAAVPELKNPVNRMFVELVLDSYRSLPAEKFMAGQQQDWYEGVVRQVQQQNRSSTRVTPHLMTSVGKIAKTIRKPVAQKPSSAGHATKVQAVELEKPVATSGEPDETTPSSTELPAATAPSLDEKLAAAGVTGGFGKPSRAPEKRTGKRLNVAS